MSKAASVKNFYAIPGLHEVQNSKDRRRFGRKGEEGILSPSVAVSLELNAGMICEQSWVGVKSSSSGKTGKRASSLRVFAGAAFCLPANTPRLQKRMACSTLQQTHFHARRGLIQTDSLSVFTCANLLPRSTCRERGGRREKKIQ